MSAMIDDLIYREAYQAAIPECCLLQTVDEHEVQLLYCWGLLNSLRKHLPMDCEECVLRRTSLALPA